MKKPTSAATEQLPAAGVAGITTKMNVISLDSEEDCSYFNEDEMDLLESSQSVICLSSSDDGDDNCSDISDDEEDGAESDYAKDESRNETKYSEDEYCNQRKVTSSTPTRQLLVGEVANLIRGGDLKKMKLEDCKNYLRNYGLLVTGTKPVLVDRIKQHIELKGGKSRCFDRSAFTINCTGDVCRGDVVMFHQKVDKKYSATPKSARRAGFRTIAGRVVKESYGAQCQQHTFTIEVLWSTGCRPLAPMKPLLVKGRNLYKRKTWRQEWADEGERKKTLDEKHGRGAAAREIRALKRRRFKGSLGDKVGSPHNLWRSAAPSSLPDRVRVPSQRRPPLKRHARNGFPCPTNLCMNQRSGSYSSDVFSHRYREMVVPAGILNIDLGSTRSPRTPR